MNWFVRAGVRASVCLFVRARGSSCLCVGARVHACASVFLLVCACVSVFLFVGACVRERVRSCVCCHGRQYSRWPQRRLKNLASSQWYVTAPCTKCLHCCLYWVNRLQNCIRLVRLWYILLTKPIIYISSGTTRYLMILCLSAPITGRKQFHWH